VSVSAAKRGACGSAEPDSVGASRYTRFVPWRHRIAVLLLTVLAGLPALGTVCALACESASSAVAGHHGTGQECDEPAPPTSGPQISGQPKHDCSTHAGIVGQPTTAPAERTDLTAKSAPPMMGAVQFESISLRDSNAFLDYSSPPGTAPPTTTPLVLRV
jgi:hypothetical protein